MAHTIDPIPNPSLHSELVTAFVDFDVIVNGAAQPNAERTAEVTVTFDGHPVTTPVTIESQIIEQPTINVDRTDGRTDLSFTVISTTQDPTDPNRWTIRVRATRI